MLTDPPIVQKGGDNTRLLSRLPDLSISEADSSLGGLCTHHLSGQMQHLNFSSCLPYAGPGIKCLTKWLNDSPQVKYELTRNKTDDSFSVIFTIRLTFANKDLKGNTCSLGT